MPTLLFKSESDSPQRWTAALQSLMPDLKVCVWPRLDDKRDVEYALVWIPVEDALHSLPNLQVIFSLGAGIDHLLGDAGLPRGVPVVRMVDPALTTGMSEYLLFHVLRYHRRMSDYALQQRLLCWKQLPQARPQARKIGIMGLGVMGTDIAGKLVALGFEVAAWSRRYKEMPEVRCFHGDDGLGAFLARTQILICLLPLTTNTRHILNAQTLSALPAGAVVINVGRGGHVVEADLLRALDSGQLSGATLDVFDAEPLPRTHLFWRHPKITITPHIASLTDPDTAAVHIVDNIRRHRAGAPLTGLVDVGAGY